jgi:YHS domain-containing protein
VFSGLRELTLFQPERRQIMQRRFFLGAALMLALSTLAPQSAMAGKDKVFTGLVKGTGAGGYDVVSYFSGAPTVGNADITSEWNGATWRFASAANKAAFDANPEQYAPVFGGYCAYAVANGYTAKGDPEAWSVIDGKLYLNYSTGIRTKWLEDVPGNITAGNANWPKVLE